MKLDDLNVAPEREAREALLACCGAEAWADRMLASRPLSGLAAVHHSAETIWSSLTPADWLEAFSRHPKIGEQTASAWSRDEQQGMSQAGQSTAQAMLEANEQYQRRFGWIFIVCANGKSAEQMLELLHQRLANDPGEELQIAAREQSKIMHLRLDKLLAE
jgi:2-oxo-4-hydroxy-4-carboxy-5-ureidoimidazoline decarboxylase